MILSDPSAERALLSIICKYGDDVYLDISDLLSESSFTIDSNKYIYQCIKKIFQTSEKNTHIDIALIYSTAKALSIDHILNKKEETLHLKAILDFPAKKENALLFATKIKKLEIARKLHKELEEAQEKILDIDGTESITNILNIAEDTVFNFASSLSDTENQPAHVSAGLEDYIQNLITNPINQVGISTGFPAYDNAIGGGLRKSTINVIAARPKTGKTLLADNMGFHIANKLNIPVLNLDTEMTKEDHINRLIAMIR
jgi:replicative DNA helicase